ncbi:zinc finger protein [Artemisia annua]|uniref:Zinc finger protein n=1 Tax=Artemisia annua TaxID=35608 RepID=A0A2U1LXM4_ARTAN|nr:zinc finger protein [Artemisia annua]
MPPISCRYVIRAKAGKKQSSKDASGKIAHSAGASISRYNELALKKEIRELLASWKPYFDASSSIFIHAPSDSRLLLFDGDTPCFSCQKSAIRRIPLTVRRPTFKEARRLYNILTQISSEPKEVTVPIDKEDLKTTHRQEVLPGSEKKNLGNNLYSKEVGEASIVNGMEDMSISKGNEGKVTVISTPLHEAAKAGNVEKVLELLEQGLDPCVIDERGRTPYMLWDWQAAKVPSPLTKEMEESQKAKQLNDVGFLVVVKLERCLISSQAEKDAIMPEAAQLQKAAAAQSQSSRPQMTKEEKLKQAMKRGRREQLPPREE